MIGRIAPDANCSAEWIAGYNAAIDAIDAMLNEKIQTHSDARIVQGCIFLINRVLNGESGIFQQMKDYGFDFDGFESAYGCKPSYNLSYFEIVQTLLLNGTSHCGGTSTNRKCNELGLDAGHYVRFQYEDDDDEEDSEEET